MGPGNLLVLDAQQLTKREVMQEPIKASVPIRASDAPSMGCTLRLGSDRLMAEILQKLDVFVAGL